MIGYLLVLFFAGVFLEAMFYITVSYPMTIMLESPDAVTPWMEPAATALKNMWIWFPLIYYGALLLYIYNYSQKKSGLEFEEYT